MPQPAPVSRTLPTSSASLPENAAEVSVNILPVLLGKDGGGPVRDFTLHQTISLALAIRKRKWK